MAKQHISLGASPAAEKCVQVGVEGYELLARDECERYVAVLRASYLAANGEIPRGLNLRIRSNRHDFGAYLDVIVEYDESDVQASNAALWLDHNRLDEWPA